VLLVTTPASGVLLPALSRAIGDRGTHAGLLRAFFRLTAALLWPCGVGLLIVAPEAMLALGGPQWLPAGPLLRALALTLVAQGLVNLCGSVLAAEGRADRLVRGATVLVVALVLAYAAALALASRLIADPLGQLQALAWAHSIVLLAVGGPYVAWCCQSAGVPPRALLAELWPALWATVAMGALLAGARLALLQFAPLAPVLLLAVEALVGGAAYVFLAWSEVKWGLAQLGARGRG
jgi:PST family polysaccharide transporter